MFIFYVLYVQCWKNKTVCCFFFTVVVIGSYPFCVFSITPYLTNTMCYRIWLRCTIMYSTGIIFIIRIWIAVRLLLVISKVTVTRGVTIVIIILMMPIKKWVFQQTCLWLSLSIMIVTAHFLLLSKIVLPHRWNGKKGKLPTPEEIFKVNLLKYPNIMAFTGGD